MKSAVLLLAFACSVCAAQTKPSKQIVEKAKAAITKNLSDPYSVVLEGLYLTKDKAGGTVLCGTINAKNKFGAYVGRTPFFYSDDKADPFGAKAGDSLDMLIPIMCPGLG